MKKTIVSFVLLLTAMSAAAQKSDWTFYAGWNHAVGDFAAADVDNNDWAFVSASSTKGGAGMGFDIGVSYRKPISNNGKVGLVFSVDLFYNAPSTHIRNKSLMAIAEASNNFDKATVTNPGFFSIPVLGGLHYEAPINERYSFYMEAQAGLSIRMVTNRGAELLGATEPLVTGDQLFYDYSYTDKFFTSPSLAFHFAFGFIERSHWMLDFGYWNMTNLALEGYEDYKFRTTPNGLLYEGSTAFTVGRIIPQMVSLRIGYRL